MGLRPSFVWLVYPLEVLVSRGTAMYIFFEKCKFFITFLRFSKNSLSLSHLLLPVFLIGIHRQRVKAIALTAGGAA